MNKPILNYSSIFLPVISHPQRQGLPCSPRWPGNPSALTSEMLGLQACATMPSEYVSRLEPFPLKHRQVLTIHDQVIDVFFVSFETESLYVALAGFQISKSTRLALNSEIRLPQSHQYWHQKCLLTYPKPLTFGGLIFFFLFSFPSLNCGHVVTLGLTTRKKEANSSQSS